MKSNIEKETALELLKEKLGEGRLLITEAVKTMVVFLGVTSALLGFAIDAIVTKPPNVPLFWVLAAVGVGTALFFLVVCFSHRHHEKTVSADIRRLNEVLGSPLLETGIVGLRGVYMTSMLFVPIALLGWLALMIWQPRPKTSALTTLR